MASVEPVELFGGGVCVCSQGGGGGWLPNKYTWKNGTPYFLIVIPKLISLPLSCQRSFEAKTLFQSKLCVPLSMSYYIKFSFESVHKPQAFSTCNCIHSSLEKVIELQSGSNRENTVSWAPYNCNERLLRHCFSQVGLQELVAVERLILLWVVTRYKQQVLQYYLFRAVSAWMSKSDWFSITTQHHWLK